MRQNF
ncbi:phospholipid-transporting ATPase ID, partial [Trichinella spiralis]